MVSFRKKKSVVHTGEEPKKKDAGISFFQRMRKIFRPDPGAPFKSCQKCGTQNPSEVLFCKECGSRYPALSPQERVEEKSFQGVPGGQQGNEMQDKKAFLDNGNGYYKSGRYNEALEMYDRALQIDREYAKAWNNRSLALSKLGREQEASDSRNQFLALQSPGHNPVPTVPRTK